MEVLLSLISFIADALVNVNFDADLGLFSFIMLFLTMVFLVVIVFSFDLVVLMVSNFSGSMTGSVAIALLKVCSSSLSLIYSS